MNLKNHPFMLKNRKEVFAPLLLKATTYGSAIILAIGLLGGCEQKKPQKPIDATSFIETEATEIETPTSQETTLYETESITEVPTETRTEAPTETTTQPIVDNSIDFEQFIEDYPELAHEFAMDTLEHFAFVDKSMGMSYSFVAEDDKILGMKVASVVKNSETARELKLSQVNYIQPVDVQDILDDKVWNKVTTTENKTALTFDAKEEYKKDNSADIITEIQENTDKFLGEDVKVVEAYQAETFMPQTVKELIEDYPEMTNEVLKDAVLPIMGDKIIGTFYDPTKIINIKWYLAGDSSIENIGCLIKFGRTETDDLYYFGSATLSKPISVENFIAKNNINISANEVERKYNISINKALQGTRDELVNAIFEVNGMGYDCPLGAQRFLKENGGVVDESLGLIYSYTLVQIQDNKIDEFTISIKQAQTDAELLQMLKNQNNYRIAVLNKQIEIEGEAVEYVPTVEENVLKSKKQSRHVFLGYDNGQEQTKED